MGSVFSTADKKISILTFSKLYIHNENRRVLPRCRVNDPGRSHTSERGKPSGNKKYGNTNTRFFTGNQAIDSAAFGAAAGVAGQYLFNSVTNPCRNGNRNKGTNNRIFGGNTGNFLLGAIGGFAGAQLVNNAQGNPCGNLFSGR